MINIDYLLKKRNEIYGVCAIWIILFHVFRRIQTPYIPILTHIISLGNMAVDIFIFFSGLCLTLSVSRHNYDKIGWKEYYKRRIIRILIPYLIIGIPYYLWNCIAENTGSILHRAEVFIANISSASFWLKGMQTTWFAYAILVFYVLFPFFYLLIKKGNKTKTIILTISIVLFAIASANFQY